jgi:hypothetical protein
MAYCVNGSWTASGRIGAGTDTPSLGLTAAGSAVGDAALRLDNTSGGGKPWEIYSTGTSFSQGNCNLIFYRSGVDGSNATMTLDWAGHVGIGTWAPTEMLHICTAAGSGPEVKLQNSISSHYIRAYDDNFNILVNASVIGISIKNCGYVGIGTTSANSYGALAVRRSVCLNSKNVSFSTSDAINSTFDIRHPGPSIVDLSSENSDLTFSTNPTGTDGTERVRITTGGNFGIGTSSPASKLTVAGDVSIGTSIGSSTYSGPSQYGAITFPKAQMLFSNTNGQSQFYFVSNGTLNSSSQFIYTNTGRAGKINIDDGAIGLDVASSAAAGCVVTWKTGISILNCGNVGIGIANPGVSSGCGGLHIKNGTYIQLRLETACPNESTGMEMVNGVGYSYEIQSGNTCSWFVYDRTKSCYRFLINCSGNVGINTSTPASLFHLAGGGTGTRGALRLSELGLTNYWELGRDNTISGDFTISSNASETMRITIAGNVGINTGTPGSYKLYVNGSFYSAGSSCEYKTNICNYNTDSCMFMKLKPVTYQYKDEWCHLGKELKSGTQIGLIAEDTAEVFPELAILKEEENEKVVRNVDYEKLSIILLSELQKLRQEVDQLKNK